MPTGNLSGTVLGLKLTGFRDVRRKSYPDPKLIPYVRQRRLSAIVVSSLGSQKTANQFGALAYSIPSTMGCAIWTRVTKPGYLTQIRHNAIRWAALRLQFPNGQSSDQADALAWSEKRVTEERNTHSTTMSIQPRCAIWSENSEMHAGQIARGAIGLANATNF
jgi:hypothetical protein